MSNFRYVLKLIWVFLVKFRIILLLGILAGFGFFFMASHLGPAFLGKSNEMIGVVGRFGLDSLPANILGLVSEGLTRVEPDGTLKPGLASSWETNDKGKTWIFHLDQNKSWQDGKKIVSPDLHFSFSDVTVEKPDVKTIVFKVQSPFAPFPTVVSKPLFKKGLLGNGAYKVNKITVSTGNVEKIVMTDKDKNRKTFYFYPTEDRAKLALKLGQISSLFEIFNPEPFNRWQTVKVLATTDFGKYAAVFFNTQKGQLTANKSLRQALAYAINKEAFGQTRALGPISPDSWAYNPQVKPYSYAPLKAKELIESLSKEEKEKLTLKLSTVPLLVNVAEKIARDWGAVGVKTSVQASSGVPEVFDAFLAIFDIPKDPDQYALWHSNQNITNITNYANPRIDKLLEDGRTQIEQTARQKIYLDFQRFLLEDAPVVFLYHPTLYTVFRN